MCIYIWCIYICIIYIWYIYIYIMVCFFSNRKHGKINRRQSNPCRTWPSTRRMGSCTWIDWRKQLQETMFSSMKPVCVYYIYVTYIYMYYIYMYIYRGSSSNLSFHPILGFMWWYVAVPGLPDLRCLIFQLAGYPKSNLHICRYMYIIIIIIIIQHHLTSSNIIVVGLGNTRCLWVLLAPWSVIC